MLTANEDYVSVAEMVEFQPGETVQSIILQIKDDMRLENAEIFELYLTGGTGVHLSPFMRTKIIIQDNEGNA